MADQTTLPTCTPGSLGPTKIDRTTVVDPSRDESAAQINLLNACTEELFRRSGLSDGSTPGSYEERVSDLEAGSTDPSAYVFRDDFDQSGVDTRYWDGGGVSLPGLSDDPPGLKFIYSAELLAQFTRNLWKPSQQVHVRCRVLVHDPIPAGAAFSIGWSDDAGHVNWQVSFDSSMPSIKGWRASNGAGGTVITGIGGWTEDVSHLVDFWIDGSNHLWVAIDEAAAVDCGAVFGNDASHLEIWGPHEDFNSGYIVVSGIRIWANWATSGVM